MYDSMFKYRIVSFTDFMIHIHYFNFLFCLCDIIYSMVYIHQCMYIASQLIKHKSNNNYEHNITCECMSCP